MEATDLDSAIDKPIAPAQEETGEENLTEAVEPVDEPEAEEVEVEKLRKADSLDELEASEEDYEDVDIETEDEVEATEENNLIPVKIDGKEEHWTLDRLSNLRQAKVQLTIGFRRSPRHVSNWKIEQPV